MTKGVAADLDPLALERQVCFALAITNRAVTPKGRNLRRQALKIPPAVVERLGVELARCCALSKDLPQRSGYGNTVFINITL